MSAVRKTWHLDGMHCPHCESAVLGAVSGLPGLSEPRVRYRAGTLKALWDADLLPEEALDARLRAEGYALAAGRRPLWAELLRALALVAALYLLYRLAARTGAAAWLNAFPLARAGMSLGMLFVVGLLTSLHCVAMCGGINIAQSARAAQRGRGPTRASVLYNLGRVTSYTLIGGLVGALGTAFSIGDAAKAGIQIAAAAFMLIMALNMLGGFSWLRWLSIGLPRGLGERVVQRSAGRSSFFVGLANGLMPCGPLQSMQLYALATGSWWMGALSMLFFSLGTAPLMLGLGLLGGRLNQKFAAPMRVFSAVLVVAMGMGMLANGLALSGVGTAVVVAEADGVARVVDGRQIVRTELDYGGYPAITVISGMPVQWTIVADEKKINGCNNEIIIPAYGLRAPLSPGENVIEFTPTESGTIPYACWMGMIRSTIHVLDAEGGAEN